MGLSGEGTHVIRASAAGDVIPGPALIRKMTWDPGTAVPMVVRATFTHACEANGNVTITLPGLAAVDIAVATDTEDTIANVAIAVNAGTFTGWTTAIIDDDDDNKVTFTQNTALARNEDPDIDFASTVVDGTIEIATEAVNGPIAAADRLLILEGSNPFVDYTAVAGGLTLERDFGAGFRTDANLTVNTMSNGHCMFYLD